MSFNQKRKANEDFLKLANFPILTALMIMEKIHLGPFINDILQLLAGSRHFLSKDEKNMKILFTIGRRGAKKTKICDRIHL